MKRQGSREVDVERDAKEYSALFRRCRSLSEEQAAEELARLRQLLRIARFPRNTGERVE